ncbi:aminotransferase class V-fold PLP-dependent enzyme [bacterium]|nr:aminotransferase class V-fold PLP-dependent enzyme [bacterium]
MKNSIKKQFPILNQKINGKPITYLDSAATTQKPQCVIDCIDEYYTQYNSNIHRSSHILSSRATEKWEEAHNIVANFLNAKSHEEVIFTRNCTEGINLFVNTYAKENLGKEDIVVLSEMEHHSNIVPWLMLQKEIGFNIKYIPVTDNYQLDLKWLKSLIDRERNKIKIVSVIHISNVLGTINDVKEITKLAHGVGATVLIDAAQSVARLPIDVQDLDCDALVFSGHKIYGPTGSGCIYIKKEILKKLPPYMGGGEMIREVSKESFTLNNLPWRFEAGTPDIAGGIALARAITWFSETVKNMGGFDVLINHEKELVERFISQFEGIEWFKLFGSTERVGAITFNLEGFSFAGCKESTEDSNIQGKDILEFISSQGICIRDGFHCAQPLHDKFKIGPTMRVSLGIYTEQVDIDRVVQIIKQGVLRTI